MHHSFSLLLLFTIITTTVFGQTLDCSRFKDGKFVIVDEKNGNTVLTREGSKQVELHEPSGLEIEFKVEWLDECTYTLDVAKVLANPDNIELPKGMILTVEMIETKSDIYVQRSTSNLYDFVAESEVHRVPEP